MRIADKHGHEAVVAGPDQRMARKRTVGVSFGKRSAGSFYDAHSIMWNMRAVHRVLDREKLDILKGARSGREVSLRHDGKVIVTRIDLSSGSGCGRPAYIARQVCEPRPHR